MLDDECSYTPERVRYYLTHWRELVEMSQGTSNGLFARSTGGTNGRFTFAIIIADIEFAAAHVPAAALDDRAYLIACFLGYDPIAESAA